MTPPSRRRASASKPGPRAHAREQGLAERDEALRLRRGFRQRHEDAAAGAGLAQPRERFDGAPRALDDDGLGALGEHRLDGALHVAIHFEHVAHEPERAHGAARVGVLGEQVARAGSDVFAPLEQLAQRNQPRPPRLARFAALAQRQARLARPRHGLLVGLERGAQAAHQAVAVVQQIAQAFFEQPLLVVGAARLDLPDLEALVRAAQARVDRGAPVVDGGEAIFGARDARQHLDERGVGRLALALERLQLFARGARGGLGERDHLALGLDGGFHRAQLGARFGGLGLLRRELRAQLRELLAPRRDRVGVVLALAATELDARLRSP